MTDHWGLSRWVCHQEQNQAVEGLGSARPRRYPAFQDRRYQYPPASFQKKVARWECFVVSMALCQFQQSPKKLYLCYLLAYPSFLLEYFLCHQSACLLFLLEWYP
ncbi:hypothetical protein MTO96_048110 [Rhipicephalus appendiculatus]